MWAISITASLPNNASGSVILLDHYRTGVHSHSWCITDDVVLMCVVGNSLYTSSPQPFMVYYWWCDTHVCGGYSSQSPGNKYTLILTPNPSIHFQDLKRDGLWTHTHHSHTHTHTIIWLTLDTRRWDPKSFPPDRVNPQGPPPVRVINLVGMATVALQSDWC